MAFFRSNPKKDDSYDADLNYTVCYIKNGEIIPMKSRLHRSGITPQITDLSNIYLGDNIGDMSDYYNNYQTLVKISKLPNKLENAYSLFRNCVSFNQDIGIPQTLVNCSFMFSSSNYNHAITIPSSAKDCSHMFESSRFNSPFIIKNGVKNCSSMFKDSYFGTFSKNINIYIPSSVVDVSNMFTNCYKMVGTNIFINGNPNMTMMLTFNYVQMLGRENVYIHAGRNVNPENIIIDRRNTSNGWYQYMVPVSLEDGNGYLYELRYGTANNNYTRYFLYNNYIGSD